MDPQLFRPLGEKLLASKNKDKQTLAHQMLELQESFIQTRFRPLYYYDDRWWWPCRQCLQEEKLTIILKQAQLEYMKTCQGSYYELDKQRNASHYCNQHRDDILTKKN